MFTHLSNLFDGIQFLKNEAPVKLSMYSLYNMRFKLKLFGVLELRCYEKKMFTHFSFTTA